ncbi:MAG: hypothetical protein MJ095_08930 [Oscillospiraceae bacterium]|nr:hypothetical protein [Oscillospiraceae bacterium]
MNKNVMENINKLLGSSDIFNERDYNPIIKEMFPDLSEEEITETSRYIEDFYRTCTGYGTRIAELTGTPFLPDNNEIAEKYVNECQQAYPGIDEKYIKGIMGRVCWLANR